MSLSHSQTLAIMAQEETKQTAGTRPPIESTEAMVEALPKFLQPGASPAWFGLLILLSLGAVGVNVMLYVVFPEHYLLFIPMSILLVPFLVGVVLVMSSYANNPEANPQAPGKSTVSKKGDKKTL
ncbi:hypothetical protein J8273_1898 [Carpediemonas membranifera]|uniref:Transmembrane protein n=1 Tax=Carpediemonas membranifera TaxID=201153 RepID=A0A8J6E4E8_9EUKA|nr:hypothetical protein J8273_1898 [Carpediemonas membranifera]|eukprot:KAG9396851.1 hypothetical protein J8273_1898 [Carpediemonas membranifera]